MSDLMKIRLLAMFEHEIDEVKGTISNERLWQKGSSNEEAILHQENIDSLSEYEVLLKKLRDQVEEGTFNV